MTIYGDGKQTRSFCYVSDLIDGIYRLMNANYSDPVNLGNPNEKNMLELAQIIRDITRAQAILGWNTNINLKEGSTKTANWFKGKTQ